MSDLLEQFLNLSTVVLCLAIFALVWVQRRAIETYLPKVKEMKSWKEFWVPLAPLGTGALLGAVAKPYPWPEMFADSMVSRMIFGIVCGLGSGLVYRLFKKNLMERLNQSNSE